MVFRLKLQWDISKLTISGMILGVVTLERGPQTLDVLGESCKRISCPPTHPNMNLSEFPWMCFWNNIFFWSFFHHRCCHLEWYTYPIIPLIKGNFFLTPFLRENIWWMLFPQGLCYLQHYQCEWSALFWSLPQTWLQGPITSSVKTPVCLTVCVLENWTGRSELYSEDKKQGSNIHTVQGLKGSYCDG